MKLYLSDNVPVFFSRIEYLDPVQFGGPTVQTKEYLLVTGIANSRPVAQYAQAQWTLIDHIEFTDHHIYDAADIQKLISRMSSFNSEKKAILTTEKDMIRMQNEALSQAWGDIPRFYLPN